MNPDEQMYPPRWLDDNWELNGTKILLSVEYAISREPDYYTNPNWLAVKDVLSWAFHEVRKAIHE